MKLLGKYLTTTTITIILFLLTLPCFGGGQGELFRVNPKHGLLQLEVLTGLVVMLTATFLLKTRKKN